MTPTDFYFINLKKFLQLTFKLAGQIEKQYSQQTLNQTVTNSPGTKNIQNYFDLIIAINRGGSVLARFLSDLLDVKMGAFAMSSYVGMNQQRKLKITQELNLSLKNKRVLLVDEICDTGQTFVKALEHINPLQPKEIITATLLSKPHAVFTPNFSAEETDKWVVFPYEKNETIRAVKNESDEIKSLVKDFFEKLT